MPHSSFKRIAVISDKGFVFIHILPLYYLFLLNKRIKSILKQIKKGTLPKEIIQLFIHAFQSLDQTKDLNLFDIKKLTANSAKEFYRLRKGKYRAIFTIEKEDYYVHDISKRSEVYKRWP